jgi:hypothetical protein
MDYIILVSPHDLLFSLTQTSLVTRAFARLDLFYNSFPDGALSSYIYHKLNPNICGLYLNIVFSSCTYQCS